MTQHPNLVDVMCNDDPPCEQVTLRLLSIVTFLMEEDTRKIFTDRLIMRKNIAMIGATFSQQRFEFVKTLSEIKTKLENREYTDEKEAVMDVEYLLSETKDEMTEISKYRRHLLDMFKLNHQPLKNHEEKSKINLASTVPREVKRLRKEVFDLNLRLDAAIKKHQEEKERKLEAASLAPQPLPVPSLSQQPEQTIPTMARQISAASSSSMVYSDDKNITKAKRGRKSKEEIRTLLEETYAKVSAAKAANQPVQQKWIDIIRKYSETSEKTKTFSKTDTSGAVVETITKQINDDDRHRLAKKYNTVSEETKQKMNDIMREYFAPLSDDNQDEIEVDLNKLPDNIVIRLLRL